MTIMNPIIEAVRAQIGVDLQEEFVLQPRSNEPFTIILRFTEDSLQTYVHKAGWRSSDVDLDTLAHGVIKRQPFKPRKGVEYWSYCDNFIPSIFIWDNNTSDYLRLNAGIVWRTKEEARANRDEVCRKITGKDYEEG